MLKQYRDSRFKILNRLLFKELPEHSDPYILVRYLHGRPTTYSLVVSPVDRSYWVSFFHENHRALILALIDYSAIGLAATRCPFFWSEELLVRWLLEVKRSKKPLREDVAFLVTCMNILIPHRSVYVS